MQLSAPAPTAASASAAPRPTEVVDDAITRLDWSHEIIGSAESDPGGVAVEDLASASNDAKGAVELLGTVDPSSTTFDVVTAARHASTVAAEMGEAQAIASLRPGEPDTIAAVTRHAEAAEVAIHLAYQALGTDRG